MNDDFLNSVTKILEENLSNESFGVSELSQQIGMSRSNLLRRIQKSTNMSASRFIREIRLKKAMELLGNSSLNVSEVSFKVGFSSTSYFIKCFHDHYGYPPGEIGREKEKHNRSSPEQRSQGHQLAAIMFTDIEGYTALMQKNEAQAVAFRNRHREVFNSATKKFKGRILQYYGDGTLSTFPSAIDAVNCAIEMQLTFRESPIIPVRIGIHSGDILVTDDDIIGDGVNVASRIESMAVSGGVFISEKIHDEVKNQQGIHTASLGMHELKNVDKLMEVFAVTNLGLAVPETDHALELDGKSAPGSNKSSEGTIFKWFYALPIAALIVYIIFSSDFLEKMKPAEEAPSDKSIAVLPFINDSNDSSNIYVINGLMESILNNLQKIEDLRVISRTSVEKYRNSQKLISEIARDLNVKYFVEGSGQKLGDKILLNVQLIEASSDKHLWSKQYDRETRDIFDLQREVAKNIAVEIKAIITPEEEARIDSIPTTDITAYDYFLKGQDQFYKGTYKGLEEAISYFEKAIEHDRTFAWAYADISIAYYFLDLLQAEKKYSVQIANYADKALLFDSQLPQSMVAKALSYIINGEYELALPFLEKAHEYHPNSAMVINVLLDYYVNHVPNTVKYLEYALKGISLDIGSQDSATASITFLHVSNAFIQSGFVDEAKKYINRSLAYNPNNLFSEYVRAYVLFAKNMNLPELKERLIQALNKDSTRVDILQEVGKICYYMRDYESAYRYYKRYIDIKDALNLDVYRSEDAKIAVVLKEKGFAEESAKYINNYHDFAVKDQSVYRDMSLSVYYSVMGERKKAIDHLKLFASQDDYYYWVIVFLGIDPLVDNIRDDPEFIKILSDLETRFWENHQKIRNSLEEKGLI